MPMLLTVGLLLFHGCLLYNSCNTIFFESGIWNPFVILPFFLLGLDLVSWSKKKLCNLFAIVCLSMNANYFCWYVSWFFQNTDEKSSYKKMKVSSFFLKKNPKNLMNSLVCGIIFILDVIPEEKELCRPVIWRSKIKTLKCTNGLAVWLLGWLCILSVICSHAF